MKTSTFIAKLPFCLAAVLLLFMLPNDIKADKTQEGVYEDYQFRFAITPPNGWIKKVRPKSNEEIIVNFINPKVQMSILTVAARCAQEYHKEIIGLISKKNLTDQQLSELAQLIYRNVPGVLDPTVALTYLASQKALASTYCYEHRTLNEVSYMFVLKVETIRGNTFFKVEITGPAAPTHEQAYNLFSSSSQILFKHLKTFKFLSGKTKNSCD